MRRARDSGLPTAAAAALGIALALFFTTRSHQRSGAAPTDLAAWGEAALWNVPCFLAWGLLALGIERVRGRFPFTGAGRGTLALHATLSVAVALVHLAALDLGFLLAERLAGRAITPHAIEDSLPRLFHLDVLLYWLVALGGEALAQAGRSRAEQIAVARLESQLAQARLAALRMQLHPHFLFNTLNSIAELMHTDVEAADRMLERLTGLLETALATQSEHEVALDAELDFLTRYLDVERVRFRDRLDVRFEIEPGALALRVPALVLQPLVENAVRHGVGRLARGGAIVVRARASAAGLALEVENDAPAPGVRSNAGGGVGLTNTAARLEELYGARARLTVGRDPQSHRFLARIEIAADLDAAGERSAA